MEDIQAIMDQLRELQAENDRLKSQVASQSGPSSAASSNTTASTSTTALTDSALTDSVSATAPVTSQLVYVPRERKCPKFSGKLSVDLITVEKWIEEARRCLSVRHMSQAEQTLFLYDHVEGSARAELDFHAAANRDSPEKIFTILTDNYSCSQSYVAVQLQFFQRSQREGESLRDYSHALKALMDIVIRKTPGGVPNSDQILRDQFTEHVHDDMLRRELKRNISEDQSISFTSLRSIAIKWAEEGRNANRQRARAYSCNAYSSLGGGDVAEANAVMVPPPNDLAELKESLKKQQAQLDAIMKHIGLQNQSPPTTNPIRERRDSRTYRFQADGKPICLRCNKAGHIARFCKVQLQSPTGLVSSSRPQTLVQTHDAAVPPTWPQEN